jgi:hypothetical protein
MPHTRTASLVFDPGFVIVIHSHFHLSFTLTSFAALYFMDEIRSDLLNKQAFFMFIFLQHFKSTSVTHVLVYHHTIFSEQIAIGISCLTVRRCR